MNDITITFNGQNLLISEKESTLLDLLTAQKLSVQTGIAVALNQDVIPKTKWKSIKLNQNDQIMVITATQGG